MPDRSRRLINQNRSHGTERLSFSNSRSARTTISTSLLIRASSRTGHGHGAEFLQLGLGRFAHLVRRVAKLLHEDPGAILQARVDAVDDQERCPDHFLGRRKNVQEHGFIDGLAREVRQHDQFARLEELLAVLREDELNDVFAQTLPRQPPGQGVVRELAVRRVARLCAAET